MKNVTVADRCCNRDSSGRPRRRRLDDRGRGVGRKSPKAAVESSQLDLRTGMDDHPWPGGMVRRPGVGPCSGKLGTVADPAALWFQHRPPYALESVVLQSEA